MHIVHDIRWLNAKFHLWESDLLLSSEKMMHSRMFWTALAVAAGVLVIIISSIIASRNNQIQIDNFPPYWFYQFNPYAR